jgi:hypothetical protein
MLRRARSIGIGTTTMIAAVDYRSRIGEQDRNEETLVRKRAPSHLQLLRRQRRPRRDEGLFGCVEGAVPVRGRHTSIVASAGAGGIRTNY